MIVGIGAVMVISVTACVGGQSTNQPSPRSSVHLSAQGSNYIGAESRLLTGFAIGVGKAKIAPGSRTAVSASDNGVDAGGQVWYGKSLQTANGFSLNYNSTYTNQPGVKHLLASGHLLVSSTATAPSLTAAVVAPGSGVQLLSAQRPPVQLLAATVPNGTAFNVGSDTGGQVTFSGVCECK